MKNVNESVRGFVTSNLPKVTRNGESYYQTERFIYRVLKITVAMYHRLERIDQTARLLRDLMDFLLRRYHRYCIKEGFGAHYREVGVKFEKCDFEHVIPAAVARELMIYNRISITQAMNIPTCMLSKRKHKILNKTKLSKTTPDIEFFWKRYSEAIKVQIETHKGDPVDMDAWTLQDHYTYFSIDCQDKI